MGFSVPLTSLISGSHLSFPNCQPSTLHPIPFLCQLHFLSCSSCTPQPNIHCPVSPGHYSLHWPWQSVTLNQPSYLVFSSHTFGLPVAAGEKHSTMPPLIPFSLYFQSYCPLNTAQGFFYKLLVGLTFLSSYRTTPA